MSASVHQCESSPSCRRAPSGYCRRCAAIAKNKTPEMRAAASRAMAAKHRDPEFQAANERGRAKTKAKLKALYMGPDARARLESAAKVGRARSLVLRGQTGFVSSRLGWLPAEFVDEYRCLRRRHRLLASEARRIIEAEIPGTAEHAKRAVASSAAAMRLKHEREVGQRY